MDCLMAVEKGNREEEDKVALPGKEIHHSSFVYFLVAAFLAIFSDPCHVIFATLSPCVKCPVGGQAWIENVSWCILSKTQSIL